MAFDLTCFGVGIRQRFAILKGFGFDFAYCVGLVFELYDLLVFVVISSFVGFCCILINFGVLLLFECI